MVPPKSNPKKRSAPQSSSSNKKPKSSAPSNPKSHHAKNGNRRSAKDARDDAAELKRKVPITGNFKPEVEDEDAEMDDEDEDVEMEDVSRGAGGAAKGKFPVRGEMTAEEYKKLSKDEKKALREEQPHRTTLLPSHPLLRDQLLPLWEEARQTSITPAERKAKVSELWSHSKGRVSELKGGHKGGRVLQTIVKYGSKEERTELAEELKGSYKQMMESKYSKFLIAKLIKFCPSVRGDIISELQPYIPTLLLHSHAVTPLADFFDLYSTAQEKRRMVRAFYPKEVLLFGAGGDESGLKGEVKGLVGMLDEMGENATSKQRILDDLQKVIFQVFNQSQKGALTQAIFHRVVLEYLQCVFKFLPEDQADKRWHELLDVAIESLPDIVHTKDGSAIVREMLARGVAKDRRNILRPFKKHLQKVSEDAEAQTVLFTAFDVVDDTKMMGKDVVGSLAPFAFELAMDKNGRKVLYYLLAPRSKRYFLHPTIAAQAELDVVASKTSKKDPEVRRKEVKQAASPWLLEMVAEKADALLRDTGASLLVNEIMLNADGDKAKAGDALIGLLGPQYPNPAPYGTDVDPETAHILDLGHAARVYKTILSGGHFNTETKSVEVTDPAFKLSFAQSFWDQITSEEAGGKDNAYSVAIGNAPFTLAELILTLKEDAGRLKQIKAVLGKPERLAEVGKSVRKGANVLHDTIAAL